MIIPIAIDLSEHDSIPEYQHDSADFKQLSRVLSNNPFILLHDGPTIGQSHFFRMIDQLPQKSRTAFISLCKKIPYRAVPDWDGNIEQTAQPSLNDTAQVLAMSRAKFHIHFEYDEDEYVAPHPVHPQLECALWKAIEHTQAFAHLDSLKTPIQHGYTRSTLWRERFAPVISADKWKRIKLVDRYILLNESEQVDFTKIDFMLSNINKSLTHPTEIEIFVQTNKYYRPYPNFDLFPKIRDHIAGELEKLQNIRELRIYACNKFFGRELLHDRFLFLTSSRDSLYTYEIGRGFTVFHKASINEHTTFTFKIHHSITEEHNKIYLKITSLAPSRATNPDYKANNVKIYRIP